MTDATTSIAAHLADAMARQTRALARAAGPALAGAPAAIHDARVASRRVRELAAFVETIDPSLGASVFRRQVRTLGRALGRVRELDVCLALLDHGSMSSTPATLAVLRRTLAAARGRAARRLARDRASFDVSTLRTRGRSLVDALAGLSPELVATARAGVSARVSHRAVALADAIDRCGTLYAVDRLHDVRLATKKLRYAIEIQALVAAQARRMAARLRGAQQALGDLHDLQMLLAQVTQVRDRTVRRPDGAALAAWAVDLERRCREVHAALLPTLAPLTRLAHGLVKPAPAIAPPRMLRMASASRPRRRRSA